MAIQVSKGWTSWKHRLLSAALALVSAQASAMAWLPQTPPRPEPPLVMRDVSRVDDQFRFISPQIPGNRTTMDGRVALVVQGGTGTPNNYLERKLLFSLLVPERLQSPIMTGPAGAEILNTAEPVVVPLPEAIPSGPPLYAPHHTICDATPEFFTAGEKPNPYACGEDGKNDCYDVTIVTSSSILITTTLFGTPATIEVAQPKTADASIVDVTLGEPVKGAVLPISPAFLEPAVTEDGRLLTGRLGGFPRPWINPNTWVPGIYGHDLVYSVMPESATPCDVTAWTDFPPMSHAPFDPNMKDRYGLAAYPFRDTEGNLIADGDDMGGTYQWVDRQGDNVFMSGMGGRITEADKTRFPRRCAVPGVNCEAFDVPRDYDRGQMVGGAWTHGKFVLLDAAINHVDWAVGTAPQAHFNVDLYRNADNEDVSVRVGSGRFVGPLRDQMIPYYPAGYSQNPNILDSVQNIFNYHRNMHTLTPRDVVWLMSNGVSTDEIAFDDYLYFDAFIVSNMQASITQGPININLGRTPHYHDGNERNLWEGINPSLSNILTGNQEAIHIQNGATSLEWNVPAYGYVPANMGRIEPVGLGGIKGKGFWLQGGNTITYTVPSQRSKVIDDYPWYISLFVDPRLAANENTPVTLLQFSDNTAIRVSASGSSVSRVQYVNRGEVIADITLPTKPGWRHLAWQMEPGNHDITLLVDGFAFDRRTVAEPLFKMMPGDLIVGGTGDPATSFRGWIDEFKVLAMQPSVEVACNHAHGTLAAIDDNTSWRLAADQYPQWAHDQVSSQIGTQTASSGRYTCFHDYTSDWGAHLSNVPDGMRSLREAINFPEGPLRFGQHRPDSTANAFCLSCHHDNGKRGLTVDALAWRPVNVEDDLRRQPSQPPQRVFGNIPAGWIAPGHGPGGPTTPMVAPPEGVKIDQWVLPQ